MAIRNLILPVTFAMLLYSCGTTNNLTSGQFSKKDSYRINSYAGCCNCFAKYFNIYRDKKLLEQIVYDYNCYHSGSTTKFIFNYNKTGHLQYCDKLIATTSDNFQIPVTAYEKFVFLFVDATINADRHTPIQTYSGIKGFRKPVENEITHSFPIKHSNVTIR